MSMLIDKAPNEVIIDGESVPIRSDFRVSMLFELMMLDEEYPEELKVQGALELYYEEVPSSTDEAVRQLMWFYSGGKTEKSGGRGSGQNERCYDYEQDEGYIYAAFRQQYGIDLESESLHWWKFRALFAGLTDDCELVKIMQYRTMKIDSRMSAAERKFYGKMKRLYALPKSQNEQRKISEIEQMLMKKT